MGYPNGYCTKLFWYSERNDEHWIWCGRNVVTVAFGFLISVSGNWQVPFIMSVVLLLIGVLVTLRIDPSKKLEMESDLQGTDISSQM